MNGPVYYIRMLTGLVTGLFVLFLWTAGWVLIILVGLIMPFMMPIILGLWVILAILRGVWELTKIAYRKVT